MSACEAAMTKGILKLKNSPEPNCVCLGHMALTAIDFTWGSFFLLLINYIVRCLPCFYLEQVLNKIKFEFALHKVI